MLRTLPLVIGYALWAIFVISWNFVDRRAAHTIATPGPHRERLHGLVLALGLIMIVVAPVTAVTSKLSPPFRLPQLWVNPPLLAWAMLAVIAVGVALCWCARLHLGCFWSSSVSQKEGHRIVVTGPYRFVRHPIYAGFIAIYVGLTILCATWLALAAVVMITVGLWLKARLEEQFLSEELGTWPMARTRPERQCLCLACRDDQTQNRLA